MAQEPVVVRDLAEHIKSFRDMPKAEAKLERERLRSVGQIVARDATGLFAPYDARSAAGYRVRVRAKGVAVAQSLKRTTGFHPEFGSMQMRRALLPAVGRNHAELVRQLTEMLDGIGRREGF